MTFNDLNIIERITKSLSLSGYSEPTPIQVNAIPALLDGKDLLASAQTGTGKTAAFAIPILQKIYESKNHKADRKIEALVLTPTRELALQVAENFTNYSKYLNIKNTTIYGGVSQKRQEESIKRGVDVVIATPGRLLDLLNQKILHLNDIKYLVLDEADQMLDMGFIKDVLKIVNQIPKDRQTMLFSATMPKQIEQLSKQILINPVRIAVAPVTQTLDLINQSVYLVSKSYKTALLVDLIKKMNMKSVLVFTRTKNGANRLVKNLMMVNIESEPIHGNKSQASRERSLNNFKSGKTKILVATDIAARGIDIEALDFVVNYDLPEVPETYIHRIGRTGRAGLSGIAISFSDPAEPKLLNQIEKHIGKSINVIEHQFQVLKPIKESIKPITKSPKHEINRRQDQNKLPDYLKFKGHKPKSKENKNSKTSIKKKSKSFVEYQKKTNPHYQVKKSKSNK
ncbi:DEAD/DEAH box helicase [Acholeplasma granularum]|uniref:DEAD/DEAH box helicase n=1 Tax=Acholeplasma granularum TaxID=264635 RepID=UPI0004728E83|nr:DEAD/DEAH box helicase [Acholeplasma granularum]